MVLSLAFFYSKILKIKFLIIKPLISLIFITITEYNKLKIKNKKHFFCIKITASYMIEICLPNTANIKVKNFWLLKCFSKEENKLFLHERHSSNYVKELMT